MKSLYKYPQAAFPYARLIEENARRGRDVPEFDLLDTGVFDGDRYFDVFVEYAKASAEDIAIRITVEIRGPDAADIDVLPTIWFRNRWSWRPGVTRPSASRGEAGATRLVVLDEDTIGRRYLYRDGAPELLFTNNETNSARLFGTPNPSPVRQGRHSRLRRRRRRGRGESGGRRHQVRREVSRRPFPAADARSSTSASPTCATPRRSGHPSSRNLRGPSRRGRRVLPGDHSGHAQRGRPERHAAGLRRTVVEQTVLPLRGAGSGRTAIPASLPRRPNASRDATTSGSISTTPTSSRCPTSGIPVYAAWDLAFHCIPLALVDPEFAKAQLVLLLREWFSPAQRPVARRTNGTSAT